MVKPKPSFPHLKFTITKWTCAFTCKASFNQLQCLKDSHIQPYGLDMKARIKCMYVQNLLEKNKYQWDV
jgi:hypothetical protein